MHVVACNTDVVGLYLWYCYSQSASSQVVALCDVQEVNGCMSNRGRPIVKFF